MWWTTQRSTYRENDAGMSYPLGMQRRRVWLVLALTAMLLLASACANILGIDDGIPRTMEASVLDVGLPDVATDVMMDAAVDAPFSPLTCDTVTCNFAIGEACCRTGTSTYTCIDAGDTCSGTLIPCDRNEQCPPDEAGARECCTTDVLTDANTYVATSVGCMSAAKCSPVPTHYVMCGDDDAAECPDALGCTVSVNTLPTFLICK
jgi:hypothetical protein